MIDYFIFIGFMIWGIFDNKVKFKGVNFIIFVYFVLGLRRVEIFIFVLYFGYIFLLWVLIFGYTEKEVYCKEKFCLILCFLNDWVISLN